MFVGNPVFPISVGLEKVAGTIEETIKKKHWKRFEKGEIKLVLTPFYFFYYDAVFEDKETERGRLALNGETAALERELAETVPDEAELVKELPDDYPLIVRKPLFSEKEAEKIALLKTANIVGVERKDVVLTGFKIVYYPMWLAFVTVNDTTHELEISAVTGEIVNEEIVPLREKGFVEITKETLSELKEPGAWVKYSKEIAGLAVNRGKSQSYEIVKAQKQGVELSELAKNPMFWVCVGLVIVIIVLILLP